jgi:hypothetical protein
MRLIAAVASRSSDRMIRALQPDWTLDDRLDASNDLLLASVCSAQRAIERDGSVKRLEPAGDVRPAVALTASSPPRGFATEAMHVSGKPVYISEDPDHASTVKVRDGQSISVRGEHREVASKLLGTS